eukprot:2239806-Heterocapsa_arctica.AAC.1
MSFSARSSPSSAALAVCDLFHASCSSWVSAPLASKSMGTGSCPSGWVIIPGTASAPPAV